MALIADILLIAGALGAAFYCFVLSRRLTRFSDLEKGMGGAVAVLSVQVDEMTKALEEAQRTSKGSEESLAQLTERAEIAAKKIELMLASMHDLPDEDDQGNANARVRRVHRNRRAHSSKMEPVT